MAQAIQYSAVTAFPIAVLAVWRPFAVLAWQKTAAKVLHVTACLVAIAIALPFWVGAIHGFAPELFAGFKLVTAYSAAVLLVLGAAISLRPASTPRAVYLPSLAIVAAVCVAAAAMAVATFRASLDAFWRGGLVCGRHMVLLVVLCAFFLFARFRFADLFVRYGIRILLAGLWASLLAFFAQSCDAAALARQTQTPAAVHVFGVILLAGALLLSFTFVDERLSRLVNRWLFRPPDYRAANRQLANHLGQLQLETEIAACGGEPSRERPAIERCARHRGG